MIARLPEAFSRRNEPLGRRRESMYRCDDAIYQFWEEINSNRVSPVETQPALTASYLGALRLEGRYVAAFESF